jgi:hypothetical protein
VKRQLPLFGILLITLSLAADARADEPMKISSEPQLFVDDLLIDSSSGLKRTLHQPKKDNGGNEPVLAITDEFAGVTATLQANGDLHRRLPLQAGPGPGAALSIHVGRCDELDARRRWHSSAHQV